MGVMQYKQNKTAPCIEFGNESLAACIFQGTEGIFFSGGCFAFHLDFYRMRDMQSVSCPCVQLQIWSTSKKGLSHSFQRAMGRDFFGESAHRHVLRAAST